MRQAHLAAIGADDQVASLQGIVGAAAVAASLRVLTLWMRGHAVLLEMIASGGGLERSRLSGLIIAAAGRTVKRLPGRFCHTQGENHFPAWNVWGYDMIQVINLLRER